MAPVSGFVLEAEAEPTLYLAGDTIWCSAIQDTLDLYEPNVIVLNAGAARFLEGNPITMSASDVITVCRRAPKAKIVAVHMEAINHCLLSREDLAFQLEAARVAQAVAIPGDGEWLQSCLVPLFDADELGRFLRLRGPVWRDDGPMLKLPVISGMPRYLPTRISNRLRARRLFIAHFGKVPHFPNLSNCLCGPVVGTGQWSPPESSQSALSLVTEA